jgi:hypothetical protein
MSDDSQDRGSDLLERAERAANSGLESAKKAGEKYSAKADEALDKGFEKVQEYATNNNSKLRKAFKIAAGGVAGFVIGALTVGAWFGAAAGAGATYWYLNRNKGGDDNTPKPEM